MPQHIFQGTKVINGFQIIYYIYHCLAEKKLQEIFNMPIYSAYKKITSPGDNRYKFLENYQYVAESKHRCRQKNCNQSPAMIIANISCQSEGNEGNMQRLLAESSEIYNYGTMELPILINIVIYVVYLYNPERKINEI